MPDVSKETQAQLLIEQIELRNWRKIEGQKPCDTDKRSGLPAYTDELRLLLNDAVSGSIASGKTAAVVKIDLETLKKLNEEHGDHAGDIGIDSQNQRVTEIMVSAGETTGTKVYLLRRPGTRSDELFALLIGKRTDITQVVESMNSDFQINIEETTPLSIHSNAAVAFSDELDLEGAGDKAEVSKFPMVGLERVSEKRLINLKIERKLLLLEDLIRSSENISFEDFIKKCVQSFSNIGMPSPILKKLLNFTGEQANKPLLERLAFTTFLREMRESLN